MDQLFTTLDVSRLLRVHIGTVIYWVNRGYLKAWKTVGGHRRIEAGEVRRFVLEHEMPMPEKLVQSRKLRLLVVDDEQLALNTIRRAFRPHTKEIDLSLSNSGVEALLLFAELRPDAML